jgi:prenyltransferase beta subunit
MTHSWSILLAILCLPGAVHAQKKDLITKDTQKAIDAGLKYLAKEQAVDGSWGTNQYRGNVAVTSLVGLAFLSGKHHPDQGDHGKVVTKAVRYILSTESQNPAGYFDNPKAAFHGPMYGQGFAVLFLADAHATIKDMQLKTVVKDALDRAVKLLVTVQNKEGGWRYHPNSNDADISVTACQVVALRAARDQGVDVPKKTLEQAANYIKRCQDPTTGGFRYQTFGGAPGFARSAAGLTALNRTGAKEDDFFKKGMDYLQKPNPKKNDAAPDAAVMHYSYGHYYAAKATWWAGDKTFDAWYPGIRDELLANRKNDERWEQGLMCAHYSTATALIILQMPHNHLSSMKR